MTPAEFKQNRATLGLTQKQLAEELDVHERSIIGWENGTSKIRRTVALALTQLVRQRKPPKRQAKQTENQK